eukprot:TRINITY_DN35094_c0_g1_i1.p2 TRINITY_DN35094_c0_g1~~TRINITY_DN35094_c0_g1_i1.p2  ORF type:complete len:173 (+),score=53.12 TRINITY_DN35094_c0_g1_i1:59-520(+)
MAEGFKKQFRQIMLNARNIADRVCSGAMAPADVAKASAADLAAKHVREVQDQLRRETRESCVLAEGFQSRCDRCGKKFLSVANANVLMDMEGAESWRKEELDEDWCYCEAEGGGPPEAAAAAGGAAAEPEGGAARKRAREMADEAAAAPPAKH